MTHVPAWNAFLAPILHFLNDGVERQRSDVVRGTMDVVGLTREQRSLMIKSGQPLAYNRIGWALSFLTRVGAVDRPSRGVYKIAQFGRQLLNEDPEGITEANLKHLYIPSVSRDIKTAGASELTDDIDSELEPLEQIEQGLERIHEVVSADLLQRLQDQDPSFFEEAVVKLLVAMGYGGADGKASVTQQSNDGGIDGVIDRDALGLDRVYIQAKRYRSESSVQRPEVQAFVGALSGKASSGVLITTGSFSKGAIEYAENAHTRIILIDGQRLASLMIRYGVGVQVRQTLNLVEVDEDFFE